MKVLMLSTDSKILEEGSEARERLREYANLFEELHIVVLNKESRIKNQAIGNLFLYATNSWNKLFALRDAYKIGSDILKDSNVRLPRVDQGIGPRNDGMGAKWVVSAQDPFEVGMIGYFLKRKFGVPLQLQVHTDFLSPYFGAESLKNKIRVAIAKWLMPKADNLRVVSERIKNSLITNYQLPITKINTLPIYVDIEKIRNAPVQIDLHKKYPQFDFIILMASRLTREKNIGMAIAAMAEVIKKYPRTGLVIVGSGPEKETLRLRSGNINNIVFEDWTNDLASYYKTADLFLLTSNYEGYGRTPIEAMAAGCPIIITDVGMAGEVVINEKSGMVVPVGDKNALVGALENLIKDKEKRVRLAAGAKEALGRLMSKEEYLGKYKKLLEEISQ